MTGWCKTWTMDYGLDYGLDHGLDYGLIYTAVTLIHTHKRLSRLCGENGPGVKYTRLITCRVRLTRYAVFFPYSPALPSGVEPLVFFAAGEICTPL